MKNKKEYSFKEIKSILPYDYPFLFIDKATLVEAGKKIVCLKNITGNEYYFSGHFKDNPVLPGAILLEAMSQAAYLLGKLSAQGKNSEYYLAGVKNLRFLKPVYPGDQITIMVEAKTNIRNTQLVEVKAFVGSSLVSKGELTSAKR